MKGQKELAKWSATYGDDKEDIKASMYGADLMIEFAKYYHNEQLNIHVVVKQSELLFCSDCNIDLKKADGFCPKYVDCEELKTK